MISMRLQTLHLSLDHRRFASIFVTACIVLSMHCGNASAASSIEHNPEVIKCADWVIDLGPEGGESGGHIVFEGTPDDLVQCQESYTGKFLKDKINLIFR